jgi:hypothetical protein
MDFPSSFTRKSLELLTTILRNDGKCGINCVIMANTEEIRKSREDGHSGVIDEIEALCRVYETKDGGYVPAPAGANDSVMCFVDDHEMNMREITDIYSNSVDFAGEKVLEYQRIALDDAEMLKGKTESGLVIPIGLKNNGEVQYLSLGRENGLSFHALVTGRTNSGKSGLLHAVITGALLKYPEQELEVYLFDFKNGNEFKIYTNYRLPTIKLAVTDSEPGFALGALCALQTEVKRRSQIFTDSGVEDIYSYNRLSSDKQLRGRMPRLLVVMDDLHVLFSGEPAAAAQASKIIGEIVTTYRNTGLNVVLCTKGVNDLGGLDRTALDQISTRITMCPEALEETADLHRQTGHLVPGTASFIDSAPSGEKVIFRAGYLDRESGKLTEILAKLERFFEKKGSYEKPRVLTSHVSGNPNSIYQRYMDTGEITTIQGHVNFGEPFSLTEQADATFSRVDSENLLLVGNNFQKAHNMLFFIMLNLLMQAAKDKQEGRTPLQIYVFNLSDGSPEKHDNDFFTKLNLNWISDNVFYSWAIDPDISIKMDYLINYLKGPSENRANIWVLISNLGNVQLPKVGNSGVFTGNFQASPFETLLKDGSRNGIFTIAWHNSLEGFNAQFPNLLSFFNKRIAFDMNHGESHDFVCADGALFGNVACYRQPGNDNLKFSPYSAPADGWFDSLLGKLQSGVTR